MLLISLDGVQRRIRCEIFRTDSKRNQINIFQEDAAEDSLLMYGGGRGIQRKAQGACPRGTRCDSVLVVSKHLVIGCSSVDFTRS